MKKLLTLALACATVVPSALAATSPWDGAWKLDVAKSHFTGTTFTYTKTASGLWHISAGAVSYNFAVDGKPYKTLDADDTVTATADGANAVNFVNEFKGKVTSKTHEVLSADGKTLTDYTTDFRPDGTTADSSYTNVRISGTTGFAGAWKSTKVDITAPDGYVISTPSPGMVKWEIPAYKESIEGKVDGSPLPITGPTVSPGLTLSLKRVSPASLGYRIKLNDKTLGEGIMTVGDNGKTLTTTSWSPGKEGEKTTGVYLKQ